VLLPAPPSGTADHLHHGIRRTRRRGRIAPARRLAVHRKAFSRGDRRRRGAVRARKVRALTQAGRRPRREYPTGQMGLRLRLILVLMIPPVLVVGVYGLMRVRTGRAELLADTERTVILVARAVRASIERGLREPRSSDLEGTLAQIVKDQEQVDRIRIFHRSLTPLFESNRLPVADAVPAEVLRRVAETGQPEGVSSGAGKGRLFSYILPIRTDRGAVVGTMEVAHLMSRIDERVRNATWDIIVRLSLLVISMTLLTGLVLQREVLRPLSRLMEGIKHLGRGE